jgi:arginase
VSNGGKAEVVAGLGRAVALGVVNAQARNRFPLILSGGCLTAVGVVAGLQRHGGEEVEVGVVWIDAHGDFNTPESSSSGYWDGMALAAICGRSLPEVYEPVELRPVPFGNVVHLAGRDLDPPEVEGFQRLNLAVVPPQEIGTDLTLERIRRAAAGKALYLHIDMDGLDPQDAPAVANPVPGGPAFDEVLRCLSRLEKPSAMTLSAMSFDEVDEEQARTMVATCVRLVETFAR